MKPAYTRAALGAVLAISALGVVPGVAFAAAPSCGDTINTNVTLHADMDCTGIGNGTALYFGKKSLTLNLNGYTIWGPVGDDSSTGVDTNHFKYDTVKNGTIADFETQVYADYSVGGTFTKLHLTGEAADTDSSGVYVYYGADNVVSHNHMVDNYYGMYLYGAGNTWVTNNKFTGSATVYGVYDEYDSFDHFVSNYAEPSYAGFYEDYSGNQTYSGNTVNGDPNGSSYGFYFDGDDYGWYTITNNKAHDNSSYGFYTYYLYEDDAPTNHRTVISGNKSNHNGAEGFYDEESEYALWSNNTANYNEDEGFYLYDSGYAEFTGNTANHNGDDGIYFYDNYTPYYSPVVVKNNTALYNDAYGLDADYGIGGATGNVAHHNGYPPDECWNIDCNN